MKFVLRHLVCLINCYSSLVIYFGVLDCLNTIFLQTRNRLTDGRTDDTYKASYRDARMHLEYGLFANLTNGLTGLQGLLCDEIEVRQLGLPNHLLNFIWDSLWGLRFPRYDLYANV